MSELNRDLEDLMKALQEMPENVMTQKVIMPLLRHLGYTNVEFYGGVNEEGKDIVCWEESRFGDKKLIVAQVKHFKFSNSASSPKSFQTVVNQLIMCIENQIVGTDLNGHYPSEALLISSYQIDSKTLQTRFSENPNLRTKRIEIIDGEKLARLVAKEKPEIAKELLGHHVDLGTYFLPSLNNKTVLKALGFHDNIVLKDIYTDIDFSLGKKNTRLFFHSKFKGTKFALEVDYNEWMKLKEIFVLLESKIPQNIINFSIDDIELIFDDKISAYKKWQEEIEKLKKEAQRQKLTINNLDTHINSNFNKHQKILSEISEFHEKENHRPIDLERQKDIDRLIADIRNKKKTRDEKENELQALDADIKSKEELEPSLICKIEINGSLIAEYFKNERKQIEDKVELYNRSKPDIEELKGFIAGCKNVIDISERVLSNRYILKNLFGAEKGQKFRKNFKSTRFKLPIDEIFNTGHNVALLGEAGAGKTTCLQMYALSRIDNKDKLIIWAPLSQVIKIWSKNANYEDRSNEELEAMRIREFHTSILEYLNSKNILIKPNEFYQNLKTSKVVLLLDGLDEAIKNNPWLPKAIVQLSRNYPKVQIIVTSRMSGKYIQELPFFSITLLPFTSKQRNSFIKKWFGDKDLQTVELIIKHFDANKSISKIVKNPLLTTTLCVLARHNLPLPQTEIRLYNDRLKLLTGYYDNVKNIDTRVTTTPQILELLSIKIAFHLHDKGVRELAIEDLERESIDILKNHLNSSEAKTALNELIDPCNILVPMSMDGQYGFGHLRYQEHLAALELMSNRSIDIEFLLTNQWWFDTLILFAQMNESIEWLVSKVNYRISIPEVKRVVYKMLQTRPVDEQDRIRQHIKKIIEEGEELLIYNDFVDEK